MRVRYMQKDSIGLDECSKNVINAIQHYSYTCMDIFQPWGLQATSIEYTLDIRTMFDDALRQLADSLTQAYHKGVFVIHLYLLQTEYFIGKFIHIIDMCSMNDRLRLSLHRVASVV